MKIPARFLAVFVMLLSGFSLRAAELPPLEVVNQPTPASVRGDQVRRRTLELREKGATAGLEALAAELRASRESLDSGTWDLAVFYDAAVEVPDEEEDARQAMDFYERWARESPRSITAQVCLAKALISYAWNARGSGWASTVTKEGWRLMRERLAEAWEVLDRARTLEEKCPGWYAAAQGVALGQGWDRDRYLGMVDEAIVGEPTYGTYYTNTCYWLFPRWYGRKGDFEKWIAGQADAAPPDQSDWQYARLVWLAGRNRMNSEMVFARGRLDWDRTRRGFEAWLKEMPDNLAVRSQFLYLALLANDRETVRQQFDVIGGKYVPAIWQSRKSDFEAARMFAYHQGKNPLFETRSARAARPAPKLSPEVLAGVKLGLRIGGGLIGGLLAGLCLLGLALQRREVWAGVIAAAASVVLAAAFGTMASVVPALALWLYFRRKHVEYPPPLGPVSGWMALLWLVVIMGLCLGLQIGAFAFAAGPYFLEHGFTNAAQMTRVLMADGSLLFATFNAFWISLLLLLVVCGPQSRAGWQERLGLRPCPLIPAVIWVVVFSVISIALGIYLGRFMDERSKESMQAIALMKNMPVLFFLTVGILGPVFEELLYRGYVFAAWIGRLGFWGATAATSLIFTASHIQYGWVGLAWVFFFGVLLSVLRWKTGSVYPGIAVHIANNFSMCVLVVLSPG